MDTTELAWLPWMLQTADALFPTGAYAHSLGFEQSVQMGLVHSADTMSVYLRERTVPALREFELPYLRFAYHAATANDAALLAELDREIGAAKLPRETREASVQLGGRRRAALRLLFADETGLEPRHHITVCGVQAVKFAAPLQATLLAYFYQTIAAIGAASLKLIRIGQEGVQRALAESNREAMATVVASLEVERDMAGWFDPLAEIASMRHERAGERLFIS